MNKITIPAELKEKWNGRHYNAYGTYLKKYFGERISKVSVDADLSCPNRDGKKGDGGCIYCNDDAFRAVMKSNKDSIEKQIKDGIIHLKNKYPAKKFIAYFQNFTNTYAPAEKLRTLYSKAISNPEVLGLAISTRPDCLPRETLDILEEISHKTYLWVELGLQSCNDKILKTINRGHNLNDFMEGYLRLKERGIRVCAHIIIGLPGETRTSIMKSAHLLNDIKIDGIKIHQLQINTSTALHNMYKNNQASVFSLEEYLDITAEYLSILSPEILVHRLFSISNEETVVAPQWDLSKQQLQNTVEKYFKKNNIWQGKSYEEPQTILK